MPMTELNRILFGLNSAAALNKQRDPFADLLGTDATSILAKATCDQSELNSITEALRREVTTAKNISDHLDPLSRLFNKSSGGF